MKTAAETVTLVREALSVADAASQQATRGASELVQHALHGDEGTSAGRSVTGDSNPEACPAWKRPVAIEATLCAQPHPFLSNMLASGDALLVPLRQRIGAVEFGRGSYVSGCANRIGVAAVAQVIVVTRSRGQRIGIRWLTNGLKVYYLPEHCWQTLSHAWLPLEHCMLPLRPTRKGVVPFGATPLQNLPTGRARVHASSAAW